MGIMKKKIIILSLAFLLVISPLFGSGALADFLGTGNLSLKSFVDPVYFFLFAIGATFAGTRA